MNQPATSIATAAATMQVSLAWLAWNAFENVFAATLFFGRIH
jgi:hypothetical protein